MTNEKKDNLILLKDLQGDVDYNNKALYNIQEDIRLILNVRVPEIKVSLSTINNNIHSLSNTVKSIEELNKERSALLDTKLTGVRTDLSNLFWALIAFDTVLFFVGMFIK